MSKARLFLAGLYAAGLTFGLQAKAGPVAQVYVLTGRGANETLKAADLTPYTDVILAFAHPDANSQLVNGDSLACMAAPNHNMVATADLQAAVDFIHAAGKRAIVSLGGAVIPSCAGDWGLLMDTTHRETTVQALTDFATRFGLDGLDVDLESELLTKTVAAGAYVPFVTDLSAALHKHGLTLSAATGSYVGGMIPIASIPAFDRVGVMAYDNNIAGEEHASPADFKSQMYLWLGRGVPANRLVMGLPFYGHGYGDYAVPQPYHDIVASHAPAPDADVVGTLCGTCSYITFNSPLTVRAKASLASRKAGGVMVWELWQDATDHALTRAMADGIAAPVPYPQVSKVPEIRGFVVERFKPAQLNATGAKAMAVAVKRVPGGQAVQVAVPLTENPWDASLSLPIASDLKNGQRIAIVIWARIKADDPDTQFELPVAIEAVTEPYPALMSGKATVTTAWRPLVITGVLPADIPAGHANIQLMLGAAAKVVEVGPAKIVDMDEKQP